MKNNKYLFVSNKIISTTNESFSVIADFAHEMLNGIEMLKRVENSNEFLFIERNEMYDKYESLIYSYLQAYHLDYNSNNRRFYIFFTIDDWEKYISDRVKFVRANRHYATFSQIIGGVYGKL